MRGRGPAAAAALLLLLLPAALGAAAEGSWRALLQEEAAAEGGENVATMECKRGCVDADVANLIWCGAAVDYMFCNRTSFGPVQDSVMKHEQAAINAYMSLIKELEAQENNGCKNAVREWMCFELFSKCTNDEKKVYPVCKVACDRVYRACRKPHWLDCTIEIEEEAGLQTSVRNGETVEHYDADGKYIKGTGTPLFEEDDGKCTKTSFGGRMPGGLGGVVLVMVVLLGAF